MLIKFDFGTQKLLVEKKKNELTNMFKKETEKSRSMFSKIPELIDTRWYVETIEIISIESCSDENTFKVIAVIQYADDTLAFKGKRSWTGYATIDLIEKISKKGISEPIEVVYADIPDSEHNTFVDFFTKEECMEYKKLVTSSDNTSNTVINETKKLYEKLVLLSCIDESHKRIVRMRWGIDPLETNDGAVILDEDLSSSSADNELLLILCNDLIPEYIQKEIKKNKKQAENKKLSETRRNIVEIRNMLYPSILFGLPFKRFTIEEGSKQLDEAIYGHKNVKKRALQYIYAERKFYWNKTIPELNKNIIKKSPVILVILGRDGSGKELFAEEIAKVSCYTYTKFDANSFGPDTQELLGSSVIYQNSEHGSIVKSLKNIGDNGCLIIKNFGAAKQMVRNALANVIKSGVLHDNNLECNIDVSKVIYILTARNRSEIPSEIFDKACVVNLDRMTEEERLVIGKEYMLPRICRDFYIDQNLLDISDRILDKLCNRYRTTNSLDQINSNLLEVLQNISNDYMEELECGKTVKVTDGYVRKCLFSGTYENYVYDINGLIAKFKMYRDCYSKEDQIKIEDLFEEYESVDQEYEKDKIVDKLRFHINYVPLRKGHNITVEDIIVSYKQIMDKEEYGHDEAKQAIIDSMIENILSGRDIFGSLKLLLYGPAGTGKTMLGHMLADILKIPFVKVSLNGKDDARTLKGFATAYRNSHTGEIASKLSKCGSRGCVLLLDEGEKAGMEVLNALFDITDPSEGGFTDDFLGDFVDMSQVILIMTCNDISKLPGPLLDRFKVIPVEGYSKEEKKIIAIKHVIPKCLSELSLVDKITFRKDAVETMISDYIPTSSVREIEKKVRKIVIGVFKDNIKEDSEGKIVITPKNVRDILGARPIKSGNIPNGEYTPGIMNCLAVRGDGGGSVFPVEIELTPYMKKRSITGSCREMILESVENADVVVSNMLGRELENTAVSFSEQAVTKDGPSAGLSIVLCMLSAHLGISLPRTIAATGEIDIKGNCFAIGGLKEKLDAARQEGVTRVYIPKQNYEYMKEADKLKDYTDMDIVPVDHVSQVAKELFGEAIK